MFFLTQFIVANYLLSLFRRNVVFYKISLMIGFMVFGSFSSFATEEWINLEEKICILERNCAFDKIRDHYTHREHQNQQKNLNELNNRSKVLFLNIPTIMDQIGQESCYVNLCKIGGILEQEDECVEKFINAIEIGNYIYPNNKKRMITESLQSISDSLKKKKKLIIDEIGIKLNHITPQFKAKFLSDVRDQRYDFPTDLQNTHWNAKRDALSKFTTRAIYG